MKGFRVFTLMFSLLCAVVITVEIFTCVDKIFSAIYIFIIGAALVLSCLANIFSEELWEDN